MSALEALRPVSLEEAIGQLINVGERDPLTIARRLADLYGAAPGSPWSDAHRHADALRIVGKRFLIDLWVASRAMANADAQSTTAREAQ